MMVGEPPSGKHSCNSTLQSSGDVRIPRMKATSPMAGTIACFLPARITRSSVGGQLLHVQTASYITHRLDIAAQCERTWCSQPFKPMEAMSARTPPPPPPLYSGDAAAAHYVTTEALAAERPVGNDGWRPSTSMTAQSHTGGRA